jgi:hypothetical protein
MNMSQRISRRLVHFPASVTFNLSQAAVPWGINRQLHLKRSSCKTNHNKQLPPLSTFSWELHSVVAGILPAVSEGILPPGRKT